MQSYFPLQFIRVLFISSRPNVDPITRHHATRSFLHHHASKVSTAPRCTNNLRFISSSPTTPSNFISAAHSIFKSEPHRNRTSTPSPLLISLPPTPGNTPQTRTDPSLQAVTNSIGTTGFQAIS